MLKLLLSFGASKEKTRNGYQSNALHYACAFKMKDIIKYLVKEANMKIDQLAYRRCGDASITTLLNALQQEQGTK
jgi:ankyrin repeat protein